MSEKEIALNEEPTKENMDKLIQNHVIGSMGVGLIPLPIVDFVALTWVQLNMIRKMASAYSIPFSNDKGKNIIGALMGSGVTLPAGYLLASLCKTIPVIGTTTGAIAMPATAGATTYAIGKVFLQHFATGGTLLNLDPEKVKDYYQQMFDEGKKVSATLQPATA
ncbi:MAG: DUF697 domain-containing protein [Candidatus Magnetomorum sp.]|nr:DUF697 domain-containing protein [Candidatus Magnetomorum sp.]